MANVSKMLKLSFLFKGFDEESISTILKNIRYRINLFHKNETIAIEGEKCTSIGIILKGSIEVQKIYPSGKTVTVSRINEGGTFGEVIIFSNLTKYPSTLVAVEKTEIMFISKQDIVKLCSTNTLFLNNFMELLTSKILMLNKKLKSMSYNTIKEKIADFILEEYKKQNSLNIKINYSRKELAEHFGIPRPSLSRELIKMKNEGIIDFSKDTITIKDIVKLEDCLL